MKNLQRSIEFFSFFLSFIQRNNFLKYPIWKSKKFWICKICKNLQEFETDRNPVTSRAIVESDQRLETLVAARKDGFVSDRYTFSTLVHITHVFLAACVVAHGNEVTGLYFECNAG